MRGETALVSRHLGRRSHRKTSRTLLPFLYNTPTLRSLPRHWTPGRSTRAFSSYVPRRADLHDHAAQAHIYAEEAAEELNAELSTPMRHASDQSSLTNAEREIFERIYQEAEQHTEREEPTEEENVERLISGHPNSLGEEPEGLDTVFERALSSMRARSSDIDQGWAPLDDSTIRESARAKVEAKDKEKLKKRQLPIRAVVARASDDASQRRDAFGALDQPFAAERKFLPAGGSGQLLPLPASAAGVGPMVSTPGSLSPALSSSPSHALAVARHADAKRVDDLLSAAKTDLDVWRVLEKEVFSRAEELVRSLSQRTSPTPAKKRKKRAKAGAANPTTIDAATGSISDSPSTGLSAAPPASPPLPLGLATLRLTYAQHAWAAQRVLRVRFPRSPYAAAVLPAIKSLGPISYALAASTELYDELLYLRWRTYRDPHACADLLGEMVDRGIATSPRTRAVFQHAALEWLAARNRTDAPTGTDGGVKVRRVASLRPSERAAGVKRAELAPRELSAFQLAWWGLEGVRSGFRRWQALEEEDQARVREERRREERARLADAQEEALEASEEAVAGEAEGMVDTGVRVDVEATAALPRNFDAEVRRARRRSEARKTEKDAEGEEQAGDKLAMAA